MGRLIDVDELIEYMQPYCHEDNKLNPVDVILDIKAQPTVDAAPVVHGKWEMSRYNGRGACSACGSNHPICMKSDTKNFPYCPYCGALMDGGE